MAALTRRSAAPQRRRTEDGEKVRAGTFAVGGVARTWSCAPLLRRCADPSTRTLASWRCHPRGRTISVAVVAFNASRRPPESSERRRATASRTLRCPSSTFHHVGDVESSKSAMTTRAPLLSACSSIRRDTGHVSSTRRSSRSVGIDGPFHSSLRTAAVDCGHRRGRAGQVSSAAAEQIGRVRAAAEQRTCRKSGISPASKRCCLPSLAASSASRLRRGERRGERKSLRVEQSRAEQWWGKDTPDASLSTDRVSKRRWRRARKRRAGGERRAAREREENDAPTTRTPSTPSTAAPDGGVDDDMAKVSGEWWRGAHTRRGQQVRRLRLAEE